MRKIIEHLMQMVAQDGLEEGPTKCLFEGLILLLTFYISSLHKGGSKTVFRGPNLRTSQIHLSMHAWAPTVHTALAHGPTLTIYLFSFSFSQQNGQLVNWVILLLIKLIEVRFKHLDEILWPLSGSDAIQEINYRHLVHWRRSKFHIAEFDTIHFLLIYPLIFNW